MSIEDVDQSDDDELDDLVEQFENLRAVSHENAATLVRLEQKLDQALSLIKQWSNSKFGSTKHRLLGLSQDQLGPHGSNSSATPSTTHLEPLEALSPQD